MLESVAIVCVALLPRAECLAQRLIAPLGIDAAGLNLGMAKVLGDMLEAAGLLQQTGVGIVAQRMDALIGHAGAVTDSSKPGARPDITPRQ